MTRTEQGRDPRSQIVAVAALIFNQGRVLAMRRASHRDAGAGLWETLSGRVEPGEEPVDAIRREIMEESGLEVELDERPFDAYAAMRGSQNMMVLVYLGQARGSDVRRSDEHDAHDWLMPSEFAERSSLTRLVESVHRAADLLQRVQ